MSKMQAAVILAPGKAGVVEVPVPVPGPGEVVVRLEGSGVCASNIPLWEGRPWFTYPAPPGSPGHEGWGRVAALGKGVTGLCELERACRTLVERPEGFVKGAVVMPR